MNHDNIYNILGKLNSLEPKQETTKVETKPIYESVDARGSVLEGVAKVEAALAEKYMGFKKVKESGLQAYLGKKKYGKDGMEALQKAGREGASKEKMALLRAKHDKMDEGNYNEDMLSPKQKEIARMAGDPDKIDAKDFAALRQGKGKKEEGNEFSGELTKARAQGKDEFEVDGKTYPVKEETHGQWLKKKESEAKQSGKSSFQAFQQTHDVKGGAAKAKEETDESLEEGWDEMQAYLKKKEGPQPKGGSGKVAGKRYGGAAQKDDEGDEEVSDQPKKKGRPKKDKFAEEMNEKVEVFHRTGPGAKMQRFQKDSPDPAAPAHRQASADAARTARAAGQFKPSFGATDEVPTKKGGAVFGVGMKDRSGIGEKAPPGDKAERMVKHIKKGYAKDGKITPKEKSIAYATAWKAHNKGKLDEGVNFQEMMREAHMNLEEMLMELQQDIAEFKKTGHMSEKLRDCLEMHRYSKKPIVDEVVKPEPVNPALGVDAVSPAEKLAPHAGVGRGPIGKALGQAGTMAKNVGRFVTGKPEIPTMEEQELNELARLAGLTEAKKCNHTGKDKECPVHGLKECGKMYESAKPDYIDLDKDGDKKESMKKAAKDKKEKVNECGDMGMNNDGMSINSNFDTGSGEKSISISARGEAAEQLAQLLKMAGLGGHSHEEPKALVVKTSPEESVEEERDIEYANTPDEEYEDVSVQTQGGDGEVAGMEKDMHRGGSARFSDNPMAAESIEMPKKISKMLEGIKKVDKEV